MCCSASDIRQPSVCLLQELSAPCYQEGPVCPWEARATAYGRNNAAVPHVRQALAPWGLTGQRGREPSAGWLWELHLRVYFLHFVSLHHSQVHYVPLFFSNQSICNVTLMIMEKKYLINCSLHFKDVLKCILFATLYTTHLHMLFV